jgi:hypothetical protein
MFLLTNQTAQQVRCDLVIHLHGMTKITTDGGLTAVKAFYFGFGSEISFNQLIRLIVANHGYEPQCIPIQSEPDPNFAADLPAER